MTISTTTSVVTLSGNGVTTVFNFPFVGDDDLTIEVSYTDTNGAIIVLSPSSYTLVINAPGVGQLWGVGGTVTYPNSGSPVVPIPTGSTITIKRIVPYEQNVSISNQGSFYPQAVEQGLDLLELQIQQIKTGVDYSIKAPESDLLPPTDLPSAAVRANTYLFFDAQGNPVTSTGVPTSNSQIGTATDLVFLSGQTSLGVADALAASRHGTLVIDMDWTLTGAQTLASPTLLFTGGKITLGSHNLTLTNNAIIAGGIQLWDTTSTGKVVGPIKGSVCIDWWGTTSVTIADTATTNAGNDCLTFVTQNANPLTAVYCTKSQYFLSGSWVKPSSFYCPKIEGNGADLSYSLTATAAIVLIGISGGISEGYVSGFQFSGSSVSWGIEVRGLGGIRLKNLIFQTNAWGIVLHNETSGQFTEFVQWSDCTFQTSCNQAWWYKITSGDMSFHGSGPTDGVTVNTPNSPNGSSIVLDAAGVVYNSPMNFAIWPATNTYPIITCGGSNSRLFVYGTITIENFSGSSLTLCTSSSGYAVLCGSVMLWASNGLNFGSMILMDEMQIGSGGTVGGFQKKRTVNITLPLHGGNITIPTTAGPAATDYLIDILINGSNYVYKYLLLVSSDAFGDNIVSNIANPIANNTAGYGAPSFTWNGTNILGVTNGSYPAGLTATVSYQDMNGG